MGGTDFGDNFIRGVAKGYRPESGKGEWTGLFRDEGNKC